jgi:hypothetical protein
MTDKAMLYEVYQYLFIIGTALGAMGSAISLHRFLKV